MSKRPDCKTRIFGLLDSIERRLGETVMIHQIPDLGQKLKSWQDGKVSDIIFLMYLTRTYDEMNSERGFMGYDDRAKLHVFKFTHK